MKRSVIFMRKLSTSCISCEGEKCNSNGSHRQDIRVMIRASAEDQNLIALCARGTPDICTIVKTPKG